MVPALLTPRPRLVVVCGPTASGKGALARALAARFAGELVSADSRKIYRGLDIGTAKPDAAARADLPHHLLDVCAPGEAFSAARFVELADAAIGQIAARGHVPVVVGGTGLYVKALLRGIIDTPPRDPALRARLEAEERAQPGSLHARLRSVDPACAARLGPGDRLRLVRALEVHALTGRRLSELQAAHAFGQRRYPALLLAPDWPRAELDERIGRRVAAMLAAGWLDEVAALRRAGERAGLDVVGYRELDRHLAGELSLPEAVEAVRRAHRRYARYQLGLFGKLPDLRWLPAPVELEAVAAEVGAFLGR
ncbi:MAG TPA: tRNA (adenosine(37)-N6)-dimethylallyltransferase MiaA [Myxococcota bacterium]|nr:tRNA (adenosine(37)-N6)-dimethylallyltransferase MiaA [Myxococcota bacterium]HRY96135.1 tRNA (adenosine(37)-N6)-dimethylallyltransferase MiaA [Myxococcota bacterium]HSA23764.1 tRNA (adenosine(37)-N6)-dimethylallyltransferase MiaA [Myxococcota bacterium]